MADRGHELTEDILNGLEESIADEYAVAVRDMEAKLQAYLEKFDKEDAAQRALLEEGKITQQDYANWRYRHTMMNKRWERMRDTLAEDMHHTNEIALGIARGKMPDVYALNANYGIYEIESGGKIDTGLALYNHDTAEYLLSEERQLMPGPSTEKAEQIAANKDLQWNQKKIQSAVTQGVLQGETPFQVANRLMTVGRMNYNAAVRYARTMTTNAQNAGRYNSYRRARDLGVQLTVEWRSVLDMRVRHEHRMMHGQRRDVDEPFVVTEANGATFEIMWPGNEKCGSSTVPQSMIWNCRCTLRAWVKGFEGETVKSSPGMEGLSFEEWQAGAAGEQGRLLHIRQVEEEKEKVRQILETSVTVGHPYVDLDYIRSSKFSRKFSQATGNSNVNDRLRRLARGSLTSNTGTYTESLYVIDGNTGKRVLYKRGKRNDFQVVLNNAEKKIVRDHQGPLIALHNHPTNVHPTGSDFATARLRGYDFGLVVTHDGRVFKYTPPRKPVRAETMDLIIDSYTRHLYNDDEKIAGFGKAMNDICERYGATWEELK